MRVPSSHTPDFFEQLRQPIDLMAHAIEQAQINPSYINISRRRAEALGVAACLATPEFVQERVQEMALLEVETGLYDEEAIYISLMRGAQPFCNTLYSSIAERGLWIVERSLEVGSERPAIDFHPLAAEINASRYGESQNGGLLKIKQRLPDDVRTADKKLILSDDVIDEGITLQLLSRYFLEGRRRLGFLQMRREGASASVGVRALATKSIADLSMFDPQNVIIGFKGPNVWLSEMGMDGEKVKANGRIRKEIFRWNKGISIPMVQDIKYRDNVEEVIAKLTEVDLAVVPMEKIVFIDTSKPRKSVTKQYFGRFVDLAKAA